MIDPMTSLAFSIYSNPGVYALLIGSGVSRSAGIPTGWEIIQDLVFKIAAMEGEENSENPIDWYEKKFGATPDYTSLLEALAKSPEERRGLLQSYFEPTDEERAEGIKVPTRAHKAVAQLEKMGFIKVIVTTNFDRLIEKALEEVGVFPQVIATPDAIVGATPLTHSHCTVIKVHGDYQDARIRNVASELEKYDIETERLLDEVFDEFGLIICGWSAMWDTALRSAFERRKNRRYSIYWTTLGKMSDHAKAIVDRTKGEVMKISDADSFFVELLEKVISLEELNTAKHPLSPQLASATVKRFLSDSKHRIALHDLISKETEEAKRKLTLDQFPIGVQLNANSLLERVQRYNTIIETLMSVFIVGGYWAEPEILNFWVKSLERISELNEHFEGTFYTATDALRKYPALCLVYSFGIAAVANENYASLNRLLYESKIKDRRRESIIPLGLFTWQVMETGVGQMLPGRDRQYTPLSNHLFEILRDPLRETIPSKTDYEEHFDMFEYLYGLIYVDLINRDSEQPHLWGPVGAFGWKGKYGERDIVQKVNRELPAAKEEWPPLKGGLFNGSLELLEKALSSFNAHVADMQKQWR